MTGRDGQHGLSDRGGMGRRMASAWYEIRVAGLVPESCLIELEGVRAVVEPVQTILRGPVPDQAALHGMIYRLQHLGLDLIEVRRLPADVPGREHPQHAVVITEEADDPDLAAGEPVNQQKS